MAFPSPRPAQVNWKAQWDVAKTESQSYNFKNIKLEHRLKELTKFKDSIDDLLQVKGFNSIDQLKVCVNENDSYMNAIREENQSLQKVNSNLLQECESAVSTNQKLSQQLIELEQVLENTYDEKKIVEHTVGELQQKMSLQSTSYNEQIHDLQNSIRDLVGKAQDADNERKKHKGLSTELRRKHDQAIAKADELLRERDSTVDALQKSIQAHKEQALQDEQQRDVLRYHGQVQKVELENKTCEVQHLQQQLQNAQLTVEAFQQREELLRDTVTELEANEDKVSEFFYELNRANNALSSLERDLRDLKGAESDVRAQKNNLEIEHKRLLDSFELVKQDNARLYSDFKTTNSCNVELRGHVHELEKNIEAMTEEFKIETDNHERELALLRLESAENSEVSLRIEQLQSQLAHECQRYSANKQQLADVEGLVSEKMDIISQLKKDINSQNLVIEDQKLRIETHENYKIIEKDHVRKNEELRRQINGIQAAKDNLLEKLGLESRLRRQLQERLLDLKGTIRVFCRVRPLLAQEMFREGSVVLDTQENTIEIKQIVNGANGTNTRSTKFAFDNVFDASSTNEDIFQEVDLLTQSVFNGFSCCIFAYGQTGSGKSHTMLSEDGIIPRTIRNIFDLVKILDHSSEHIIYVSFFEIYNEQVHDLTVPSSKASPARAGTITGVQEHLVQNTQELTAILLTGIKHRSVGATRMNKGSSRSHTVYSIKVHSTNKFTGAKTTGKLNLVDLAGSERLEKSQVTGYQLRETQAINKSLSALGDVIYALNTRPRTHVPYRNSKLTHMLHDSLTGKSKTLMVVNISPALSSLQETITSLRFAEKVNSTKLS